MNFKKALSTSIVAGAAALASTQTIAVEEWDTCSIVRTGISGDIALVKVACPVSSVEWLELSGDTKGKFAAILTAMSLGKQIKINFDQAIVGSAGFPELKILYMNQ